jgi:hypothetical protein
MASMRESLCHRELSNGPSSGDPLLHQMCSNEITRCTMASLDRVSRRSREVDESTRKRELYKVDFATKNTGICMHLRRRGAPALSVFANSTIAIISRFFSRHASCSFFG